MRSREGEDGGKRSAEGGAGRVGRVEWIWALVWFFSDSSPHYRATQGTVF